MNRHMRVISAAIASGAILLCSCSTNLGPETLPSTTPATETSVQTVPSETEDEFPEHTEPASQAIILGSIVESCGALSIDGTKIVNSEGETVVLQGMSSYGIEECGDFFTSDVIKTLAEDWGCDVLRIAITGDENSEDCYLTDPDAYFDKICKICDMCTLQGIYVIVDWNVIYLEDSDENKEACVNFFSRLSAIYCDSPNIIYEINNDPYNRDEDVDSEEEWDDIIKPFAEDVIEAIRENDEDNIIIVGAPDSGSDIDVASDSPLDYDNVAYSCRFFSGASGQSLRDKVQEAIDDEVCVFVTQWGLCNEFGGGGIHIEESNKWVEFLDENEISWCNYAIGSERDDDANALHLYSDRYTDEQKAGHWPDGLLSYSGSFVREQFLKIEDDTPEETTETIEVTESTEE